MEANNVIIGTAGHVDHGKTCLIKALTGIDTDRLKEEKKRGITIELGFAHLDFEDGKKVGIIDVPGHEKFVKNMLAGAGGIDVALLIVAANEGVMPQTREHLEILRLLNIKAGVIALTKVDMVDTDWIEMVKEDIRELVKGCFLEDAPIIETSVYDNRGIDELKNTLRQIIDQSAEKDLSMPFRIPIDRIFSVDGFGTVITGTLVDGIITKSDSFHIYTEGLEGKIRNIQVHDTDVEQAFAGQRVAVNLSGVKKEDLKRGYVVAQPDSMENTYIVDVKLNMLSDTERTVKNGSRLHFYHGSRDILCKVVLLDREEVKQGESCYAQLRLEEQVALKYNDRYIVRFYSPLETVGGGVVLNPLPRKHTKYKEQAVQGLEIMEKGTSAQIIENIVHEKSNLYPSLRKIQLIVNMSKAVFQDGIDLLKESKEIVLLENEYVISRRFFDSLGLQSSNVLKEFHTKNPFKKGMNTEEYKSKVLGNAPDNLQNDLLNTLLNENVITLKEGLIKDPKFKVKFNDNHIKIAEQIQTLYLEAGYLVPNRDDVLKMFKDRTASSIMDALIADGTLVIVDKQMIFHQKYYQNAIEIIREAVGENGQITLGEFRDRIQASRKYAVALLEHFDQKKITKKVGDARILLS